MWSRPLKSGRLCLRMHHEAGRGFKLMLLSSFMSAVKKKKKGLNWSFHVKDATVNILWIWMIIFKIIFTNVLLFRHVRVNECVSREVDCILYGMFNVKKKKKKSYNPLYSLLQFAFASCPALCDCHLQNYIVQFNAVSVPPPLQFKSS